MVFYIFSMISYTNLVATSVARIKASFLKYRMFLCIWANFSDAIVVSVLSFSSSSANTPIMMDTVIIFGTE